MLHYRDASVVVFAGDCLTELARLKDASVDSVVTDPPYGLEFMGKAWDKFGKGGDVLIDPASVGGFQDGAGGNPYSRSRVRFGVGAGFQQWCELWATECLRVLKPGGHLLAFGGTRTSHRLACAIEEAGFEIRDSIAWLYGSGFPKSHDVSKAIDRAAGAERASLGIVKGAASSRTESLGVFAPEYEATAPASNEARIWQGWGTALKPAHEPIVVARKPLAGTVAANVLLYGTGALNVDGCRVSALTPEEVARSGRSTNGSVYGDFDSVDWKRDGKPHPGRWPANVVLDEDQAAVLDAMSGDSVSKSGGRTTNALGAMNDDAWVAKDLPRTGHDDSGGASRFFYCAKAPKKERPLVDGKGHPTCKPLTLMRYLVRLVTPPGGLVLDPFAGSGTTVEACLLEGFRCITIEREPDYLGYIMARIDRNRT